MTDFKPLYSASDEIIYRIDEQTKSLAVSLGLLGPIHCQLAGKSAEVYVTKIDPRDIRKVLFLAKARDFL